MRKRRIPRVGIVGAGQLGRMLALAGYPMNLRCLFLDTNPDAPAAQVAPLLRGALDDPKKLAELARRCDVVTFDWENVAAPALAQIGRTARIRPPAKALAISQDRLLEKRLFEKLRVPVAPHAAVERFEDLVRACRRLGPRGLLKTRRLGYDGKGQVLITRGADLRGAWERLRGAPLIYEQFMRFSHEISLIGVRSVDGAERFYPLARNVHQGGILRYSLAPYEHAALERTARAHMRKVLRALNYVGVLAIEFFVVDGKLVANEMAPRVHNSGHWTIEGCVTSQFENHLRAICALPLGETRPLGHAAMINFIGTMPKPDELLRIPGLAFHEYGKIARPGRKLGHCTIVKASPTHRNRALQSALKQIRWR